VPERTPHRDEFPLDSEFEVLHIMFNWEDASALFPPQVNRDLARLPRADKQAAPKPATDLAAARERRRGPR
jgi:hypothetical protein